MTMKKGLYNLIRKGRGVPAVPLMVAGINRSPPPAPRSRIASPQRQVGDLGS